jgi:tRNA threonylcarbamoyladenosine biosynthesis protein TsaB
VNCFDSFRRKYMLLLALDTSTRYSSVALCSESELYGEYTWYSGNNHNVELFEYTQRLCMQAQVSLQQVELIAVAIGPGSFNGVRVALATAKTLAFALRKPLVGVSTLDILAFQQYTYGIQRPVCAILEAGRSEVYAAYYMFDDVGDRDAHGAEQVKDPENAQGAIPPGELSYRMKRVSDYLLVTPQQLVAYLQEHMLDWFPSAVRGGLAQDSTPAVMAQGPTVSDFPFPGVLFCGEISRNTHQVLYSSLPQQSLFVRGIQATRRAVSLATIALQQLHEGRMDDPLTLEPLYLRRPSITKSTRKQPVLGDTTVERGQVQEAAKEQVTEQAQDAGQEPRPASEASPQGPTVPVQNTGEREKGALRH